MNFSDLGLKPELTAVVAEKGYTEPTPIQKAAIPAVLSGRDVLAGAQTGTGKTAAFVIPATERLDPKSRAVQVLVLAPTRELAVQVAEATNQIGRFRRVHVLPLYGGQAYDHQLRALKAGVHVVVGTPGRVMDHIRRGTLVLDSVRLVVLDEADEMLDMGFLEDVEFILSNTPKDRQTALFSATLPPRLNALVRRHLREPKHVSIAADVRTVPQVRQVFYQTTYAQKPDALSRILDMETPAASIVFCRTRSEVDEVALVVQGLGYSAEAIHGGLSQPQRERILRRFRDGRVEVLVATDVAARGLDIPEVTHVINYDIPEDADAYIHRIGRTGRMGREGEAITFVTPREFHLLRFIERHIHKKLRQLKLPTQADIASRRRAALQKTLRETIEAGVAEAYTRVVTELARDFEPLEVAAAAAQIAFEGQQRDGAERKASGSRGGGAEGRRE